MSGEKGKNTPFDLPITVEEAREIGEQLRRDEESERWQRDQIRALTADQKTEPTSISTDPKGLGKNEDKGVIESKHVVSVPVIPKIEVKSFSPVVSDELKEDWGEEVAKSFEVIEDLFDNITTERVQNILKTHDVISVLFQKLDIILRSDVASLQKDDEIKKKMSESKKIYWKDPKWF